MHEARRLLRGQGRERDRRRVRLSSAPPGTAGEQLWAGRADDEQRNSRRPVDEVIDEVEQAVVRPVQVLEDEDERVLLGERFEEPPPGRERLGLAVGAGLGLLGEADQRAEVAHDPVRIRCVFHQLGDNLVQLLLRLLLRIGLEDAGVRLHHLAQRPVGHALAVRETASLAPVDELGHDVERLRRARRRAGSCRSRERRRA